jgi:hypothetical protein
MRNLRKIDLKVCNINMLDILPFMYFVHTEKQKVLGATHHY